MPHFHDHELKIDSTTDQFTLVKDENGKALYQVIEDIPQYQPYLAFTQDDWNGGHGQYDFAERDKYFDGQSIDTTQKGKVFLGPAITEVYSATTEQENYRTGFASYTSFGGTTWLAQTFTPSSTHTIKSVKISGWAGVVSPGTLTVSIKATDGSGKPTGADLCSATFDGSGLVYPSKTYLSWVDGGPANNVYTITFETGTSLTSGTKYAIVARITNTAAMFWGNDNTSPTYSGGSWARSTDSGSTWTLDTGIDLMFSEYSATGNELDSTPETFSWFQKQGRLLCSTSATSGAKIHYYDGTGWVAATAYLSAKTDSGITTNEAVDASETVIDTSADPTALNGKYVRIGTDAELMLVTGVSASPNNITVTRGVGGTTATTHSTGTAINSYTTATTLNLVKQLVEFDSAMYAARGQATPGTWASGDEYYTSLDGIIWVVTNLADCYADGFLVAPNPTGTADNIWKFRSPNQVSRTTNGQEGGTAWQSPTYVGDTTNDITNMFLSGDKICVGKTDGLSSLDSDGGVHPMLPDELKVNRSTDNFKFVTNWQSASYFSLQRGGGEITTSETFRPFSPLLDIDEIAKIGDIVGLTSDRDWMYGTVRENGTVNIFKGRENLKDGRLRWEWCPWVYLGSNDTRCSRVVQHTTNDRRLWFGYGTHTAYVRLSENPLADATYKFCSSGFIRMSYDYGTNPNWDKLWQSAVLEVTTKDVVSGAVGATAGETVQVQYLDDADTTATSIVSAATTNGVYESNFSSAINNKRVQYRLDLASNTSTATPIVTFFQAKGTEKPTTVRVHEAFYSVGDKPSDRAATLRSLLRTARTSTSLVRFADLRYGQSTSGTNYVWCVMMPGYPKEVEIVHEKGRQPELAIQVRLQEISFTIS